MISCQENKKFDVCFTDSADKKFQPQGTRSTKENTRSISSFESFCGSVLSSYLCNLRNLRIVSDQPVAKSFGHGFGLGVHLQFLVDVLQMEIDSGGCYA